MAKFYAKAPNGDDAVLSISIQAFTQSLQQNGWCKLPNGLIIQWRNLLADETDIANKYFTIRMALDNLYRLFYMVQYIGSKPTTSSVYNGRGFIGEPIVEHTYIHVIAIYKP